MKFTDQPITREQLGAGPLMYNRSDQATRAIINMIARTKPLDAEEQSRLAVLARGGDDEARRQLIECNMRFIYSVAKIYGIHKDFVPDLFGEGIRGLARAIEGFDETKGITFLSYAVHWIRSHMVNYLTDNSRTVRIPLNKVTMCRRIQAEEENRYTRQECPMGEHDLEAVAHEGGNKDKIEDVYRAMEAYAGAMSLDNTLREDSETTFLEELTTDTFEPTDAAAAKDDKRIIIEKVLSYLTDYERGMIVRFYGIGRETMTTAEIADEYGLTMQRVQQVLLRSLRKLRKNKSLKYDLTHDL